MFRYIKRDKLNIKTDNLEEIDVTDLDIDFFKNLKSP